MKEYLRKFAEVLVNYSLNVKPKEKIVISGQMIAADLIQELYKLLLEKNAYPIIRMTLNNQESLFFEKGKKHHLEHLSDIKLYETKNVDGFIRLKADTNTKSLSNIDPKKAALTIKTNEPIKRIILDEKKWVLTLFPTEAYAQDAEMSLDQFNDFVVKAIFLNKENPVAEWKKVKTNQQKIITKLKNADKIKIVSKDTNLSFSIKGRKFINSCGLLNMPSGEVFTSVVEDTVNGYINFSFPACYMGREVDNVYLEFEKGKVIKAKADKNENFLNAILNTDEGARYLGEFAFGLNYGITKHIKNILFDEKIGGTIHLAVGSSYKTTNGKNESAVHWDMIKDLRKEGEVLVNDKVFFTKGKVV